MNLTITDSAKAKIKEILSEEPGENSLRVFVQGGGCSGFQYGFAFDNVVDEDDFHLKYDGFSVLVDAMSAQYLNEASIDFKDDIMGAAFSISNPNATSTCGCGSSFSA